MTPRRVPAGPVPITPLGRAEALERLAALVKNGHGHYVCFCEANLLSHCLGDDELVAVLERADLTLPDGTATALLARLTTERRVERVPGPDFMIAACEYGVARGWRHFFVGGVEGAAAILVASLRERFPGIEIAGWFCPPFQAWAEDDQHEVEALIERTRPHLVWVALGSPRQEYWMADEVEKLQAPVFLGVGAAFDFHTGMQRRAPRWLRHVGLEWLYRMATGGRRVLARNLQCVPRVGALLAREWVRIKVLGLEPGDEKAPEGAQEAPDQVEGSKDAEPPAVRR